MNSQRPPSFAGQFGDIIWSFDSLFFRRCSLRFPSTNIRLYFESLVQSREAVLSSGADQQAAEQLEGDGVEENKDTASADPSQPNDHNRYCH